MSDKIYVIGHKSPDLDSVAAAIAYANLRNVLEQADKYIPVIAGEANKETKYILEKFGFTAPGLITDATDKNIVMVDHNESAQAVDGIANAKILAVVDHHKFDFKYSEPICINVRPWGATCSIVTHWYFKNNLEIGKNLASLMLAAILVDTVITKSPTCTEKDIEIITRLSEVAGIGNWKEFGMEIFKVRASVSELSEEEIIISDFKKFPMKAGVLGIGQVETADLSDFANRENAIIEKLKEIKNTKNYHTIILFITDIINEGSLFLVVTDDEKGFAQAFGKNLENNRVYLEGVLSRKKQVMPKLQEVFDR